MEFRTYARDAPPPREERAGIPQRCTDERVISYLAVGKIALLWLPCIQICPCGEGRMHACCSPISCFEGALELPKILLARGALPGRLYERIFEFVPPGVIESLRALSVYVCTGPCILQDRDHAAAPRGVIKDPPPAPGTIFFSVVPRLFF